MKFDLYQIVACEDKWSKSNTKLAQIVKINDTKYKGKKEEYIVQDIYGENKYVFEQDLRAVTEKQEEEFIKSKQDLGVNIDSFIESIDRDNDVVISKDLGNNWIIFGGKKRISDEDILTIRSLLKLKFRWCEILKPTITFCHEEYI